MLEPFAEMLTCRLPRWTVDVVGSRVVPRCVRQLALKWQNASGFLLSHVRVTKRCNVDQHRIHHTGPSASPLHHPSCRHSQPFSSVDPQRGRLVTNLISISPLLPLNNGEVLYFQLHLDFTVIDAAVSTLACAAVPARQSPMLGPDFLVVTSLPYGENVSSVMAKMANFVYRITCEQAQ